MPLNVDRYPGMGERQKLETFEEVLGRVRAIYPEAYAEGSTGSERTFYVGRGVEAELVAHAWSPRGRLESWYLRIADPVVEPKPCIGRRRSGF